MFSLTGWQGCRVIQRPNSHDQSKKEAQFSNSAGKDGTLLSLIRGLYD